MPIQVKCIKEQVMTSVEFPELAVDGIEVLLGKEIGQLGDVRLFFQQRHIL